MNKVNRTEITKKNINLLLHKDKVRFALFCAKQVKQTKLEAIECIRIVELWLDGKATMDECRAAATAAYYAVYAANVASHVSVYATAYTAAYAVTDAHRSTAYATRYASNTKHEVIKQEEYLYELIHINEIVEQILLCD